jgi:DNA-binding XRE family transcriptional regulator
MDSLTKRLTPRHATIGARGNLYVAVRRTLGLSREALAEQVGVPKSTLMYRERVKVLYNLLEVVELFELSKLSPDEFMKLLKDIA